MAWEQIEAEWPYPLYRLRSLKRQARGDKKCAFSALRAHFGLLFYGEIPLPTTGSCTASVATNRKISASVTGSQEQHSETLGKIFYSSGILIYTAHQTRLYWQRSSYSTPCGHRHAPMSSPCRVTLCITNRMERALIYLLPRCLDAKICCIVGTDRILPRSNRLSLTENRSGEGNKS
jgi:hypothetical protein